MPIIALIVGILLVYVIHRLLARSQKGGGPARWILGGGMIVTVLLASRVFGARVLYAFIPAIQRWMLGGGDNAQARTERARSQPPANGQMTREEAALILGVEPDASKKEVQVAYKELMLKLHPDRGGNDYLAGKLNAARETLLG